MLIFMIHKRAILSVRQLSSLLFFCKELQVSWKLTIMSVPGSELTEEIGALFLHSPTDNPFSQSFVWGDINVHTPETVKRSCTPSSSCLGLDEHGLFRLLCYFNTEGSFHSLHSDLQPVICKYYSI